MRLCSYCDEEIQVKSAGDESWNYCESCNQTEGDTYEADENDLMAKDAEWAFEA